MGKEQVYGIRGVSDVKEAQRLEQIASGLSGVEHARVTMSVGGGAWDLLVLSVTDGWCTEWEDALARRMSQEGWKLERPPLTDGTRSGRDRGGSRTISLSAAVSAVIVAVVIAVLLTFSLSSLHRGPAASEQPPVDTSQSSIGSDVTILDRLFHSMAYNAPSDEALIRAVLKAYVAATGDPYAAYYTAEEYAAVQNQQNGVACGVGISVTRSTCMMDGQETPCLRIVAVTPDSPADEAGLLADDCIVRTGMGQEAAWVRDIGYDATEQRMIGKEGTLAEFAVYRADAESAEASGAIKEYSIRRVALTTQSVIGRRCASDSTVGIVRIEKFDHVTATQFTACMDALLAEGCTAIVLDVRSNPGGLLSSVEDVLVYFLQEGDALITVVDRSGARSSDTVTVDANGRVMCGSGKLTREDVGKYRNIPMAVLVNDDTASAAELFTADLKYYDLATVVGTTTYGKGCMQTPVPLEQYGIASGGALKVTTHMYMPAGEVSYDGVGIEPQVEAEAMEGSQAYPLARLPEELDAPLQAALRVLRSETESND